MLLAMWDGGCVRLKKSVDCGFRGRHESDPWGIPPHLPAEQNKARLEHCPIFQQVDVRWLAVYTRRSEPHNYLGFKEFTASDFQGPIGVTCHSTPAAQQRHARPGA